MIEKESFERRELKRRWGPGFHKMEKYVGTVKLTLADECKWLAHCSLPGVNEGSWKEASCTFRCTFCKAGWLVRNFSDYGELGMLSPESNDLGPSSYSFLDCLCVGHNVWDYLINPSGCMNR